MSKKIAIKSSGSKALPANDSINAQIVLSSLEEQASPLLRKLKKVDKIEDNQQLDKASGTVKALKQLAKIADEKEKSITKPLEQAKKATIQLFSSFKNRISEAESSIKLLIAEYEDKQEQSRLQLEQSFEKGKIKKVEDFIKRSAALQTISSSTKIRKIWKAEIVDESKIPREFMEPDMQKIQEHLKNGGKQIPGVEWKQVKSIAI